MAYGLVVFLTLQQLRLSLQLHYEELEPSKAPCIKINGYLTCTAIFITIACSQLIPGIQVYMRIGLIAFGFLLGLISYTYSVCVLIRLLNRFNDQGFAKEVKSIKI